MALWKNVDNTDDDKPKFLSTTQLAAINLNTTQVTTLTGFDVAEAAKTPVTHAGWVKVNIGTGGRAGRKQYETLVAMGSLTGSAADDSIAPEPTVVITGLNNLVDLAPEAPFTLTASVTFTGTGTLSYQWQSSTDGVNYTNIAGKTSNILTGTASATNSTTDYYRLLVKIGTKVIGSADVSVTTAGV